LNGTLTLLTLYLQQGGTVTITARQLSKADQEPLAKKRGIQLSPAKIRRKDKAVRDLTFSFTLFNEIIMQHRLCPNTAAALDTKRRKERDKRQGYQ